MQVDLDLSNSNRNSTIVTRSSRGFKYGSEKNYTYIAIHIYIPTNTLFDGLVIGDERHVCGSLLIALFLFISLFFFFIRSFVT